MQFLEDELPPLLDELGFPEEVRYNLIFMQDGAPPHYAAAVRNFLNQEYPNAWIGRGGPIAWPPRSPDLNACDYFLWGHMKDIIYKEVIDDRQVALGLIQQVGRSIPPHMIQAAT